jgi:hypothetical protein
MRDHRRGIILLSTLLSVLLLASLAALLQQQVTSNLVVMARLERAYKMMPAADAIRERMRAILGDVAAGLPVGIAGFNTRGEPFVLAQDGQTFEVTVNDVDGLVDVYLASTAILAALPRTAGFSEEARQDMLRSLPAGSRYPVLDASLAQLGLAREDRLAARDLTTQSSENGQLRLETVPPSIAGSTAGLSPLEVKVGQISRFRIDVQEVSDVESE